MPTSISNRAKHKTVERARKLGFDLCRVTSAETPALLGEQLDRFLQAGYHGDMHWMAETRDRRRDLKVLWPDAVTAIVVGLNYGPDHNPLDRLEHSDCGVISVYAGNRDYHDLIKGRLKEIAGILARETGDDVKVFVDTAPIMEKPLAERAGIGWRGKHTNLVSRDFGSWLFLGVILTSADLPLDEPEIDHCGTCRRCLDICPTDAFPEPYQLDARRCISYLTIEHQGPIPHEFRKAIGNRIYGCDDCLAVCPWNKFAAQSHESKLSLRDDLKTPDLEHLAGLNEAFFRKVFAGSPIKRIGYSRFLRNVLIAIGNSQKPKLINAVLQHLYSDKILVKGAAIWALGQLSEAVEFRSLYEKHISKDISPTLQHEWLHALNRFNEIPFR